MSLWTEKYKPTKIKQLVGNKRAINLAVQWINKYKEGLTDKRALFISGPPGIGKTTFAQILLKDKKFNLIEFRKNDVILSLLSFMGFDWFSFKTEAHLELNSELQYMQILLQVLFHLASKITGY